MNGDGGLRWRKLWRDLRLERERALLMIAAITLGVFALGTVLGAYTILTREMSRSYRETTPASATIEVAGAGDALVAAVRQRPGIAAAEARASLLTRVRVGSDWRPLLLFAVDDFDDLRLNTFTRESGAWPPPDGTFLLERAAVGMLEAGEGDSVLVKPPHGRAVTLPIAGLVHDPGLAPAWQERGGYGYISTATYAALEPLHGAEPLDELRVLVANGADDAAAVERETQDLARSLAQSGHSVEEIRIPPPGRHPHQNQMTALLLLMVGFAVMIAILAAILVATAMATMLGRHVREIGILKAIGASSTQIFTFYAAMIGLLGLTALLLGVPPSLWAARQLAGAVSRLLNFDLASRDLPASVLAAQIACGLVVPLLLCAVPIRRASRISVREAIDDYGITLGASGDTPPRFAAGIDRRFLLPLRNALRRRGRLLLTTALLAAGGGMFMAALNLSQAWQRSVQMVYEKRHYDLEIRLSRAEPVETLLAAIAPVEGVRLVEPWGYAPFAVARPGEVAVTRVYPDGAHAGQTMLAPPLPTSLISFPVLQGRWLEADDTDAIVLNQVALAQIPGAALGGAVELAIDGRSGRWTVVGVVEEIGAAANVYVSAAAFAHFDHSDGAARMLRIATTAGDPARREAIIRALEARLDDAGIDIEWAVPLAELRTAVGDHIVILVRSLSGLAALLAAVGGLGLFSAMSMSVIERTREIGVLRALGAASSTVLGFVLAEGLLIAVASWFLSLAVALPLTSLFDRTVGSLAFRTALPFVFSPLAALSWLGLSLVVAALATSIPAARAARLTVVAALGRV